MTGGYARAVRVFGPVEEGSTDAPVLLTIVLESDRKNAIEVRNPTPLVTVPPPPPVPPPPLPGTVTHVPDTPPPPPPDTPPDGGDTDMKVKSTDIIDSTADGRALLTASDNAAQRRALRLGTAALSDSDAFARFVHRHVVNDIDGIDASVNEKVVNYLRENWNPGGGISASGRADYVPSFADIADFEPASAINVITAGGHAAERSCSPFRLERIPNTVDITAYEGKLAKVDKFGQKWRYVIDDGVVVFKHTGAVADDVVDCVPYFNAWKALVDALNLEAWTAYGATGPKPGTGPDLNMAHGLFEGWFFSNYVSLKSFACKIYGQGGTHGQYRTSWRTPANIGAILLDDYSTRDGEVIVPATGGSAGGTHIEGFIFLHYETPTAESNDNAIFSMCKCVIIGNRFTQFATGVYIYGQSAAGGGGNANHCIVRDNLFYYMGRWGVQAWGSDANAGDFYGNHYYGCRLGPFREGSFLGNNWGDGSMDRCYPDALPSWPMPDNAEYWAALNGRVYHVAAGYEVQAKTEVPGTGPAWMLWYVDAGQEDYRGGPDANYTVFGVVISNSNNRASVRDMYIESGFNGPLQLLGHCRWYGGGAKEIDVATNCTGSMVNDNVLLCGSPATRQHDHADDGVPAFLYTYPGGNIGPIKTVLYWIRKLSNATTSRWAIESTKDDEYHLTSTPGSDLGKAATLTGPNTVVDADYNATVDLNGWIHLIFARIGVRGYSRELGMKGHNPTGENLGKGDTYFGYDFYKGGYAGWRVAKGANAPGGSEAIAFGAARWVEASASMTPGTLAAGASSTPVSFTVTNDAGPLWQGDLITGIGYTGLLHGCEVVAEISGMNTITAHIHNSTGSSQTPDPGVVRVKLEYFSVS